MAAPSSASMPQFTNLGYNTTVTLEALDPTTGAPVDGVAVSAVEIWADITEGDGGVGNITVGNPLLIGSAIQA